MKTLKRKCAKEDYKYSSLPHTRKEQFSDVFRHNFRTILTSGIILLISSIPSLVFSAISDVFVYSTTVNSGLENDELSSILFLHDLIYHLGFVLLLLIVLLGVSIVLRILRDLIWGEGIDLKYEIKMGLKQNYKPMLLGFLLCVPFYALSYLSSVFFLESFLSFLPMIIFAIFILPIFIWYLLLSNIYESGLKKYIYNSCFFYVKDFGFSLIFSLMVIAPYLVNFLPFQLISIKYTLLIVITLIYYPICVLVLLLRSSTQFDKYINQEFYPDLYNKGLFNLKNEGKK